MRFWKDKVFLKTMIAIVVPIALQNLIISSLNMVDTLMISGLGESSIAAVGLANQIFFFYNVINFGIHSGSSIFIAQYWGKEDVPNIKRVLGVSLFLTTIVGIIFTIAGFLFPRTLMQVFTHEEEVIILGIKYLRIVSLSYLITGISFAYSIALRSTGRPKVPMIISGVSFIANTTFNYLLIFGKFGFPALGVKGAALGTLIARLVEITFLFYIVYRDIGPLSATLKELIDWNKAFIKKYIDIIIPVVMNEGFWALGQIMYSIAYARIGKEATAAVQLTNTIQNIFFVFVRGLANACAVVIGNKIGRDEDKKDVYDYAIKSLSMALIIGGILGGIMAITSGISLKMFRNLNPDVYRSAKLLLIFMGIAFPIRSYNATAIVGVLRGGGDAKCSMILEMGAVWLIGVPLGFLASLVFKYPVYIVFLFVASEEVFKFIISIPRIISKKWIKILT